MSEGQIREWLEYERDLKRELAMLKSKHKTLRNIAHILSDMGYQQHKNATDTEEIERTRINSTRNELLQAGITLEDINNYATPAFLPPEKKSAAYSILDRHT